MPRLMGASRSRVASSLLLDEYFEGDNPALGAMAVFGPLAVQQLLTFINLRRASLLLFTLLFVYGFAGAATAHFDLDVGVSAFACGWFLYVVSADMYWREAYRELTPLFFTLGSGLMLAGVSYHVGGTIQDWGTAGGPAYTLRQGGPSMGDFRYVGGGEAGDFVYDPSEPGVVRRGFASGLAVVRRASTTVARRLDGGVADDRRRPLATGK